MLFSQCHVHTHNEVFEPCKHPLHLSYFLSPGSRFNLLFPLLFIVPLCLLLCPALSFNHLAFLSLIISQSPSTITSDVSYNSVTTTSLSHAGLIQIGCITTTEGTLRFMH